jgi:Holliday junction resolvasome RuvABC endonuclease subunit
MRVSWLIDDYDIDEVVFEDIQLQGNVANNVATFKALAEVFGVLYELFVMLKLPRTAVLSTVWKSTLGIKGKDRPAQKKAAQAWVEKTYGVKPTQDECDAICIGAHYVNNKVEVFDWS